MWEIWVGNLGGERKCRSLCSLPPDTLVHSLLLRPHTFGSNPTLFKIGHSRPPFPLFSSFQCSWQYTFNINIADDWIRTADPWSQKQPLYQLSHTTALLFPLKKAILQLGHNFLTDIARPRKKYLIQDKVAWQFLQSFAKNGFSEVIGLA